MKTITRQQFSDMCDSTPSMYISWTGASSNNDLLARIHTEGSDEIVRVTRDSLLSTHGLSNLCGRIMDSRQLEFGVIWNCQEDAKMVRAGAAWGITIDANSRPGFSVSRVPCKDMCCMAYDIEVRMEDRGIMPIVGEDILSISAACTCGEKWAVVRDDIHVRAQDQWWELQGCNITMTTRFIDMVVEHRPMWLIGWNSAVFNNMHLEESVMDMPYYRGMFRSSFFRASGGNRYSNQGVLEIDGVNNIDLMVQVDGQLKGAFDSLRMASVAAQPGVEPKGTAPYLMDSRDQQFLDRLLAYIQDCVVCIWGRTSMGRLVESECCCMRASPMDVSRYITGRMCQNMVSSFCLSKEVMFGWRDVDGGSVVGDYVRGGHVMTPQIGLHYGIAVVYFTSMYPNVMLSCNMSHDTLTGVLPLMVEEGCQDVRVVGDSVQVDDGVLIVVFSTMQQGVLPAIIGNLLHLRKEWSHDKAIKTGIKSGVNSSYGTTASPTGNMYCLELGKSVTAAGRWMQKRMTDSMEQMGLSVIYGDSDLCFIVVPGEDTAATCQKAIDAFHNSIAGTRFQNCSIEMESILRSMVLLTQKNYAALRLDGTVAIKGLAAVRRDRAGIQIQVVRDVIECMLTTRGFEDRRRQCAAIVHRAKVRIYMAMLSLEEVQMETKIYGVYVLMHVANDGSRVLRDPHSTDDNASFTYLPKYIWDRVSNSVEPILQCA